MPLDCNQYRMIVESSPNMLWRSGRDGLCNFFNTRWLEFTGKTMEQEVGNGWADGVHPDDLEFCLRIYTEAFEKQKAFEMEYRLLRRDGQWRWINDRGVPFYSDEKEFEGYIGSCMDITEKVEGERLKILAQKDGLTCVNNRQYFEQLAVVEIEKAHRFHLHLCMIILDLNKFKLINDTYGHQYGDEVIKAFANILKSCIREFDILGRYGGDEFIILLPNTDEQDAAKIIARIEKATAEPILKKDGKDIKIVASYGLSAMEENDTIESLFFKADEKMYKQKNAMREKQN